MSGLGETGLHFQKPAFSQRVAFGFAQGLGRLFRFRLPDTAGCVLVELHINLA